MAWISFPDPHHPFDCPEPWSKLHDPTDVDLPQNRTRDFDDRPWWHRAAVESEPQGDSFEVETRKAYSRIPPQTDEQLREIIANTYGQISLIDYHIGRILNALREAGVDENTYIIYSADHGDWLGDHGLVLKGPMFYEGLLRIPLIVRGPGVKTGQVVDEPVSNIDVGPTMYDLGNVDPLQTQHGTSLKPLLEGHDAPRDYAMSEWELLPNRVGVALSLRVVRSKTDKLTMDMRSGEGEMYDLLNDPDEMVNVFKDPNYAERRAVLEGYLAQRPNDMGPIGKPVGPA
jgi:arylsulfatase A-like enzyme